MPQGLWKAGRTQQESSVISQALPCQVEERGFLQRLLAAPMPHSQGPSPIPPSASWGTRGVGRRWWGGDGNWAQVNPPLSLWVRVCYWDPESFSVQNTCRCTGHTPKCFTKKQMLLYLLSIRQAHGLLLGAPPNCPTQGGNSRRPSTSRGNGRLQEVR